MMFILLLLALAVSAVGAWASRRWRTFGQVLMVAGILSLTVISILQFWQMVSPTEEKTSNRGEMSVGSSLANCVLGDLDGQNGTVILLFPPRALMTANAEEGYEFGFTLPFRHAHGQLHLKALVLEAKPGNAGYDLAAFQQVLEKTPDALAVVSYAGVPVDFDNLFAAGQSKSPRFYVFDSEGTTNWVGPLKDGHVRAVALPRPGADLRARQTVSGRPEEIFEKFYLLATQETADQVASQLGKR
jgi:hypothetical protein